MIIPKIHIYTVTSEMRREGRYVLWGALGKAIHLVLMGRDVVHNMKNRFISIIVLLVFTFIFNCHLANAADIGIDENILTVSSGPVCEDCLEGRYRYRMMVTLSEVSMSVYVQKISYGDENCCKEIISTFEIDPDKLEGEYGLFNVSDITWKSYDSFFFKGNSVYYLITNLDEKYKCIRKSERP